MTERNDEIAAFQILWPYSGWQAFELAELSLHLYDDIAELSLHLYDDIADPYRGSLLEWA